ncbi:MAG: hypothetical protein HGA66_18690, partial [Holophaga sp.]|nr:hypothetical protein [Holophaga sp.]
DVLVARVAANSLVYERIESPVDVTVRSSGAHGERVEVRLLAEGRTLASSPLILAQGSLLDPRWRLVKVTDAAAEFQNVRFADLRHRIDAVEARGPAARVPSNEF